VLDNSLVAASVSDFFDSLQLFRLLPILCKGSDLFLLISNKLEPPLRL